MNNSSVYKDAAKFTGLVFIIGIVEFIIFSVFLSLRLDILIGVVYGCAFVSLNFFFLAFSVKKSIGKEGDGAKAYMATSYSVRLLLTAAMLIIAAKVPWIHLWAAIIPLVFQRLAVHIVSFLNNRGSENS